MLNSKNMCNPTEFKIIPIGYVKNNIIDRSSMLSPGIKSIIEIKDEFISALDCIEENSHIIVFCFFHLGKRDILKVHPQKFNIFSISKRGVFATRSPDRPNPISFAVVKLLKRNNNILEIEKLDAINNTPVVDIKPYITDMDGVFNAQKFFSHSPYNQMKDELLYSYLKEGISKFLFEIDDSLELGIKSMIKIIKKLDMIPDRNLIDLVETDYTSNALDCLYYFLKFTPGENKIKVNTNDSRNSYVKLYLKTKEIFEIS